MDINKIFGSFNSSSRDEGSLSSFTPPKKISFIGEDSPSYKLGMFRKLILNYLNYTHSLIGLFDKAEPGLDVNDIKRVGEAMLYERAFEYIKDIDLHDKTHINALFREARESRVDLESALNKSIDHFEVLEEYEKCAVLKKYLDFLNLSS